MTALEQQALLNQLDKEWASTKTADNKQAQENSYTGMLKIAQAILHATENEHTTRKIYRHNDKHSIINWGHIPS